MGRHSAVMAAGLAAALLLSLGCARPAVEPAPTPPPVVTVAQPQVHVLCDYEDFTGRTEPYRLVEIRARVTGYLERVYFQDGQDVEAGAPLFQIDASIYKAEYERAAAALLKAERHLETMRLNYERAKYAYERNATAKEAYDQAVGELAEAEADVAAARAARDLAATNLAFTRISAPFAGRLSRRLVDPGNLVRADDTILTTLVALDRLYATFDVDERTVLRFRSMIAKGEYTSSRERPRPVYIGLATDEESFPLAGRIVFTDNQIDSSTGTLRIRALLENPRITRPPWYMLSPGQFIRVRLPLGPPHPAVLIPEKAIGTDQGQKYVFVLNAKNEVQRRNVRLGARYGAWRVIEDKVLSPEDRVIVEGLLRVRPGVVVQPKVAELPPLPEFFLPPEEVADVAPPPRPAELALPVRTPLPADLR
ncbi:MAG: efflux RND transporter periplasmic adaptor subunit [Thermogemmata sp.]